MERITIILKENAADSKFDRFYGQSNGKKVFFTNLKNVNINTNQVGKKYLIDVILTDGVLKGEFLSIKPLEIKREARPKVEKPATRIAELQLKIANYIWFEIPADFGKAKRIVLPYVLLDEFFIEVEKQYGSTDVWETDGEPHVVLDVLVVAVKKVITWVDYNDSNSGDYVDNDSVCYDEA